MMSVELFGDGRKRSIFADKFLFVSFPEAEAGMKKNVQ
jgi:hypothetical protein